MAHTTDRYVADETGIARFFHFAERQTSLRTELLAGLTTFVVMAYIIVVNPSILSSGPLEGQGPPFAATVTATCLAAGLMSIAMGLYTNYPFALAPGLGLNAVVAFQLIQGLGLPWPAAMGVVFLEGLVITLLVLAGFRQAVMQAIPLTLKRAIGVGIGLFILFIGLNNAGLVQPAEGTPLQLGPLTNFPVVPATLGIFLTILLVVLRLKAALLLGILGTTVIGISGHYGKRKLLIVPPSGNLGVSKPTSRASEGAWGEQELPLPYLFGFDTTNAAPGTQGALPATLPSPSFATIGAGLNVEVFRLVGPVTALLIIFSLMLTDFFDTMGTIVGVGEQAGFVTEEGELPGSGRVLLVDSLAATFGGIFSASSVTTYIESGSGVAEGGRTGLTAVVTGLLFLVSIILAPFAEIVPSEATAPALIIVGFLMCGVIRDIDFKDITEGLPALLTITFMPFTYSITNGIGVGFIAYVFVQVVAGRRRAVHPLLWLISAAFVVYFLLPYA